MIKYQKYETYKDLGVAWLGKIPSQWKVDILQHLFFKLKRTGFQTEELLSVYRDRGVIVKSSRDDNHNNASEDLSKYQLVKVGDLAINKMKAWQGSLGISKHQGIVSPAYYVCKPTSQNNLTYLHYLLRSDVYIKQYERESGGIRNDQWDLRYERFRKLVVPIPEIGEQIKIAKYLDEKTNFIDQIIEKKKKLIELLKEKRTAIINHHITNSEGEIGKIKYYVSVNPSKQAVSLTNLENKVSFVPMEALSETGKLELQEKTYKEVKEGFTYFRNSDVVLAKITPCYENGKAGVMKGLINGFGFGTTEFMVLRTLGRIVPEYLYYLIFSDKFRKLGEVEMRGTAGQKRVTNSFVKNYEFKLPKIVDQKKVVDILDKKTALTDLAILKTGISIDMLKEFKSSLISNVVTGKVKI